MDIFIFENCYGECVRGVEYAREHIGEQFWLVRYNLDEPLTVQGNMPPTMKQLRILKVD
jgi:hypothetical protein